MYDKKHKQSSWNGKTRLNWTECHSEEHEKNRMGECIFQFVDFVKFDLFIIHVLRNCYEKKNEYIFKEIWKR